jgi:NitT/TauT family transport system substrate-binding protein
MVWRVRDAHSGRLAARSVLGVAGAIALVLASSCSVLSGSSDSSSSGPNTQNLEKPSIKVGGIASASSAVLYIAQDKGYFKQEGLNVQVVTTTNGNQAIPQLVGNKLDITLANDVLGIQSVIKGVKIKLVFDGPSTSPRSFVISALPSTNIKSLADLAGKKVGVSSTTDIVMAALKDELTTVNVDPNSVNFVTVPYAQSKTALQQKTVDATVQSEPYATETAQSLGARPVVDVFPAGSEAANIPNAGYFANTSFVQNDPKTLAAFQKAMAKAAADAANRQTVETAIGTHIKSLSKQVLDVMALPGFPADLDPARIQRVADLMTKTGGLKTHFDVRQMLAPFSASS